MPSPLSDYVDVFRLLIFLGVAGAAAYHDVKNGRVPNLLTASALFGAVALAGLAFGLAGLRTALFGALAGGGVLLIIYLMGVALKKPLMGAGDVKLMAALGAFSGPAAALFSIFYALFFSGVLVFAIILIQVLRRRPIPRTMPFAAMLSVGALWTLVAQRWIFFSPFLASLPQ